MPAEHKPDSLEKRLFGMTTREREALVEKLLEKHATEEDSRREYAGEVTIRAKILAALREYPGASYHALSILVFGDESLEHRMHVTATMALMGKLGTIRKVGRGRWEAAPPPGKAPKRSSAKVAAAKAPAKKGGRRRPGSK